MTTTTANATRSPFTQKIKVRDAFGVEAREDLSIGGFEPGDDPRIPALNPNYRFRKDQVMVLLGFLSSPNRNGLYLTGPTGSGKSSLVTQAAARLNWPVQSVTCCAGLEFNDLVGQFLPTANGVRFFHNSLALAMKHGHILLLNEVDTMDPSQLVGLNDIIEGQPLVIPQNEGEVIRPHPAFRVVVTGNSAGGGDQTGLYQGVLRQNLAFMDRFGFMKMDYPTPDEEKAILAASLTKGTNAAMDALIDNMIKVANDIRRLFIGSNESGNLSVTLSTRGLLRWMDLHAKYRRRPDALAVSLDQAVALQASPAEREAIHRIAQDVFGDNWTQAGGA